MLCQWCWQRAFPTHSHTSRPSVACVLCHFFFAFFFHPLRDKIQPHGQFSFMYWPLKLRRLHEFFFVISTRGFNILISHMTMTNLLNISKYFSSLTMWDYQTNANISFSPKWMCIGWEREKKNNGSNQSSVCHDITHRCKPIFCHFFLWSNIQSLLVDK